MSYVGRAELLTHLVSLSRLALLEVLGLLARGEFVEDLTFGELDALAAAAYVLEIVVLGEFLDDSGADWRIWRPSLMGFCCSRVCWSLTRASRSFCGWRAACRSAELAAGVLTTVFFAQNARELAESLILVEMLELRSIVSVVRAARGDVAMRGGFAACGAAEMSAVVFLAVVACVR